MYVAQTDPDELIQTALNWAGQFADIGVPDDLTAADAMLIVRPIHETLMESSGPQANDYKEWTVTFRDVWAVDLSSMGIPDDPPRRIRY